MPPRVDYAYTRSLLIITVRFTEPFLRASDSRVKVLSAQKPWYIKCSKYKIACKCISFKLTENRRRVIVSIKRAAGTVRVMRFRKERKENGD